VAGTRPIRESVPIGTTMPACVYPHAGHRSMSGAGLVCPGRAGHGGWTAYRVRTRSSFLETGWHAR